jgi:hypothetical protein
MITVTRLRHLLQKSRSVENVKKTRTLEICPRKKRINERAAPNCHRAVCARIFSVCQDMA